MELHRMIPYSFSKIIGTNLPGQLEVLVSQEVDSILSPVCVPRPASAWSLGFTHAFLFMDSFCSGQFCSSQIPSVVPIPESIKLDTSSSRNMTCEKGL
jgi:hypothetical protein